MMKWSTQSLEKLVLLSDSGTWGDEGNEFVDSPVLRSTNIQDSDLILENFAWRIVPKAHRDKKKLDDGDIIVTTSSGSTHHIGKCCLFRQPPDGRNYYFSNFTIRLRPDIRKLTSSWLQYWLSSPQGRAVMAAMNNTTTGLRNLDRNRYLSQEIPLPPLEEQKRIAAILDKADRVRRKRQEAIRLTEELGRSIFLDMFGDPVTNPKGWEIKKLSTTFSKSPQIGIIKPAHADGHHPVIRVGEIGNREVDLEKCGRVTLSEQETEKFKCNLGDVLLARAIGSESHLGKASMLQETDQTIVFDSHVMRLRFDSNIMLPDFFLQWLTTQGGRHLFMKKAGRTAVQFNVNGKQISSIDIPLPPVHKQREFSRIYLKLMNSLSKSENIQELNNNLFNSLLQGAFQGKL